MTRVFVLDDHDVVRRGLRDLLEADGDIEVVGEAGCAVEARSRIPRVQPDVAVLDVRLSDGSGVEICREVRSQHPEIKCVMFSAFDDDTVVALTVHSAAVAPASPQPVGPSWVVVDSILAGASGFVLKEIKGGEIVNAVRMVASGESLFEPAVRGRVLDAASEAEAPATVTRPARGRG